MTAATRPRFEVPPGADAATPPEARGLARDQVRLLAASPDALRHLTFRDLPAELFPGDLLVVNTSATLPSALDVVRGTGASGLLHVAGAIDRRTWVVEVRRPANDGSAEDVSRGELLRLPGEVSLEIRAPYPDAGALRSRLWTATPTPPVTPTTYLPGFGRPIRYGYVPASWPLSYLQTVYADTPGSAEMPSAGRPFTGHLLRRLERHGVAVAPLVLHTGVSSPEAHEPPAPEWFSLPERTAAAVAAARGAGHRVVAVGTTVVRALESALDERGGVVAREGWTDLVLDAGRPAEVVDAIVTGLHPPEASHLHLLESVVGPEVVDRAYAAAVAEGYRWHEFGDSMLLSKV